MIYYIDHFMQEWLLPPGCNLLLGLIGLLLWRSRPTVAKSLLMLSLISVWVLSLPLVAQQLTAHLQNQYAALSPNKLPTNQSNAAIVVLDAGTNPFTPEYGKPTVSEPTLTRLRYAAYLHKKTHIPILVSGNYPLNTTINEADQMAQALKDYFKTATKWKEDRGLNTAQEGLLTTEILKKFGIKKIYLVTHALHMPRSVYAFKYKGIEIIPAPTGYISVDNHLGKISNILPSMEAFRINYAALREYIGIAWYKIHYAI